jgi:hypothetical protein
VSEVKIIKSVAKNPYTELVEQAVGLITHANQATLKIARQLGEVVAKLTSNRAAIYGDKTVENMADDMAKRGFPVSPRTLYDAQAIYRYLNLEQFKLASEGAIPTRNVIPLCTDKLSDDARTSLLKQIIQRKLDRDQVVAAVQATVEPKGLISATTATDSTDNATDLKQALRILRGVDLTMSKLCEKSPAIADSVKLICRESDEKAINDAFELIDSIEVSVDTLHNFFNKELTAARPAFEKVKELLKKKK